MNKPYYQCAMCNQSFQEMADLHAHEQEFHNPQEDTEVSIESAGGPFPCPECGTELPTAEEVEEHMVQLHPTRTGMGEPPIRKSQT
jgi:DNA-directed RNA polymerase subunit RPC12/RpoP